MDGDGALVEGTGVSDGEASDGDGLVEGSADGVRGATGRGPASTGRVDVSASALSVIASPASSTKPAVDHRRFDRKTRIVC